MKGFGTLPGEATRGWGGKGRPDRGEAKASLAAFKDGDGRAGELCLTHACRPLQKRSNHTGKEVEKRGDQAGRPEQREDLAVAAARGIR